MKNIEDGVEEPKQRVLTWGVLGLRVLFTFALYCVASVIFNPYPTGQNWTFAAKLITPYFAYFLDFFAVFGVSSVVALLFAGMSPTSGLKDIPRYLNGALVVSAFVAAFFVYGGWYGTNKILNGT